MLSGLSVTQLETGSPEYRLIHDLFILLDDGDRRVLRPFNLTPTQFTLLTLINTSDGERLITLSERLLCVRSTVTRMVDQLENAGLVERRPDPEDRRAFRVVLTPAGEDVRLRAHRAHEADLNRALGRLSGSERRQLVELLTRMRQGLVAHLHGGDGS